MNEKWIPVREFETYEVSTHGRIRSLYCNGRARPEPLVMRQATNSGGYKVVSLRRDGKTYVKLVHILVLSSFSDPQEGLDVCHNNGVPGDNRLENLRWDSRSGNIKDKLLHDTHNRGERNPRTTLTDDIVAKIKFDYISGKSVRELAKEYKISLPVLREIIAGRSWKTVGADMTGKMRRSESRLSEEQVDAIVEDVKGGVSVGEIAKRYNCRESSVSRAFQRKAGETIRSYRRSNPGRLAL